MKPYADSNFLVRLYLKLPETQTAAQWTAASHERGSGLFPLTWLHRVEVANAFQLHVFLSRAGREPRVTAELAASAHVTFRQDASSGEWFDEVGMELASVHRQVEELLLRHSAKHGFRTYDLLHVSQALVLGCDTFLSFDKQANKLAHLEGLKLLKS